MRIKLVGETGWLFWTLGMDVETYMTIIKTCFTGSWARWTVYRSEVDMLDSLSSESLPQQFLIEDNDITDARHARQM